MAQESKLMREFMYQAARRFPDVRLFRRNIIAVKIVDEERGDRFVRAGIKGQCDLYAYLRGGFTVELETKAKKTLSEHQKIWRDWCFAWGIPWLCLRVQGPETPAETVTRWLDELARVVEPRRLLVAALPALARSEGSA